MDCLYEWWWAVYPLTDVASAIDALAHLLVRWCLLNVADHPPCAETLAHLHAALRPEQQGLLPLQVIRQARARNLHHPRCAGLLHS